MDSFEDTRKLIALKRYETPGEEYFENFLTEFHQRQRAEVLKLSAWQLLRERFDTWLIGWHGQRWLTAGAGAAFAAIVGTLVLFASNDSAPVDFQNPMQVASAEIPDPASLLREF